MAYRWPPRWLCAFVGDDVTVYGIRASRGLDVVDSILGKDYSGLVGSDGWSVSARLENATKQTCNAHLIRRCANMLEVAVGGAVRFPRDVKQLLQDGLRLRDRRLAGEIAEEAFTEERSALEVRLSALFRRNLTEPANDRLWKHLAAHHDEIFTYPMTRSKRRTGPRNKRSEVASSPASSAEATERTPERTLTKSSSPCSAP